MAMHGNRNCQNRTEPSSTTGSVRIYDMDPTNGTVGHNVHQTDNGSGIDQTENGSGIHLTENGSGINQTENGSDIHQIDYIVASIHAAIMPLKLLFI
jgi:hypothetical protein